MFVKLTNIRNKRRLKKKINHDHDKATEIFWAVTVSSYVNINTTIIVNTQSERLCSVSYTLDVTIAVNIIRCFLKVLQMEST